MGWNLSHPSQGLGCPCVLLSGVETRKGKGNQWKSQFPGVCLEWGAGRSKRVRDEHLPYIPRAPIPTTFQPRALPGDAEVNENVLQLSHQTRKVICG